MKSVPNQTSSAFPAKGCVIEALNGSMLKHAWRGTQRSDRWDVVQMEGSTDQSVLMTITQHQAIALTDGISFMGTAFTIKSERSIRYLGCLGNDGGQGRVPFRSYFVRVISRNKASFPVGL